ncbi:hypothetical protein C8Q70DRAFT_1036704 [Cubamyces menziesii]|nr:hypothetical protein C8Q70DRAFT_1036704 [Cubamyces menziesii]
MPPHFCPMPYRYAAVRMDPVAMVEHLQDPIALSKARAIQPKTYLVFMEGVLELPFPGKPWYRFCVCPIGTSLRPEDNANDFRPEMCIPILPNKSHPTGRLPLVPDRAFPFDNCYHWMALSIYVRVRARPEGFEEDHAIRLSVDERLRMDGLWEEDDDGRDVETDDEMSSFDQRIGSSSHSIHSGGTASDTESMVQHSPADGIGDVLAQMNIFGDPTHDTELFPLVDLWFEITDHLKQEDIPDPMEIFKERDEIVKIIEEARARANFALNKSLLELNAGCHKASEDCTGTHEAVDVDTKRVKDLLSAKYLPRLRRRCQPFIRRLRRFFIPPYIPVWP